MDISLLNSKGLIPVDFHILAGQSNMVCPGAALTDLPTRYIGTIPNCFVYDGTKFANLDSNINNNEYPFKTGHFGPEFSYIVDQAINTGREQYFVKYAIGGTSLYPSGSSANTNNPTLLDWCPSTNGMYLRLINTLKAAVIAATKQGKRLIIKSIFWMQGESDANNSTKAIAYYQNIVDFFFKNLLPDLKNNIDSTLDPKSIPIIVPRISSRSAFSDLTTVRQAQQDLATNFSNVKTFDTDLFTVWAGDGLNLHYDYAGQILLGGNALAKLNNKYVLNEDYLDSLAPASFTVTDTASDGVVPSFALSSLRFDNAHTNNVLANANKVETGFILNSFNTVVIQSYFTWVGTTIPVSAHCFVLYKDSTNFARVQSRNTSNGLNYRIIIQVSGSNVYDFATTVAENQQVKIVYNYNTNEVSVWQWGQTATSWAQMGTTQVANIAAIGTPLKTLFTSVDFTTDVGGTRSIFKKLFMANKDYSTPYPI